MEVTGRGAAGRAADPVSGVLCLAGYNPLPHN